MTDVGLTDGNSCNAASMIFDLDFHPQLDFVAAGLVDGTVELWQHHYSTATASSSTSTSSSSSSSSSSSTPPQQPPTKVLAMQHHGKSCRALSFDVQGTVLYTGSSDLSVAAVNTTGNVTWRIDNAHTSPINCIRPGPAGTFFSGDDDGCLKVWDIRQKNAALSFDLHKDFISDIAFNANYTRGVTASGDGTISILNLRQGRSVKTTDMFEDDQLSVLFMKNDNKIVTGTQSGVLNIWSWGAWDDITDRIPGHPQSVQTMLKYDENTLLTGSSDGIIRIVGIHPNKLLGMVGEHEEDFPIEKIALSRDRSLVGSISHDNCIKFWDIRSMTDVKRGNQSSGGGFNSTNGGGGGSDSGSGSDSDSDEDMSGGSSTSVSKGSSISFKKGGKKNGGGGEGAGFFDDL